MGLFTQSYLLQSIHMKKRVRRVKIIVKLFIHWITLLNIKKKCVLCCGRCSTTFFLASAGIHLKAINISMF